jgi:hypothetical protein
MPAYQNTSVDSDKLILGNAKIETAASAGGSYTNLGAGIVTSFTHTPEFYDSQAGNAPDPVEGVANETATIEFEMIEYDGSVLAAISCGLVTESNTTTLSTMDAGGNTVLTDRAFRITNSWISGSTTVETILTLYKATLQSGISINFKSDNDTDPVGTIPGTIVAKLDATRTAGSQLFQLTRVIVE